MKQVDENQPIKSLKRMPHFYFLLNKSIYKILTIMLNS